jgi:hypothetical protein
MSTLYAFFIIAAIVLVIGVSIWRQKRHRKLNPLLPIDPALFQKERQNLVDFLHALFAAREDPVKMDECQDQFRTLEYPTSPVLQEAYDQVLEEMNQLSAKRLFGKKPIVHEPYWQSIREILQLLQTRDSEAELIARQKWY